jgi:hypothetical protein
MKGEPIIFRGTSMFPVLKTGDMLHIDKAPFEQLRVGDLVVVDAGVSELPIVHRIVSWKQRHSLFVGVLKGDSLDDTDKFELSKNNYGGRVWARDRDGKRLDLNHPLHRCRARCLAMLSVRNLTPGALRIKLKKPVQYLIGWLPCRKSARRFIIRNLKYFFFIDPQKDEKLFATFKGRIVGEVRLGKNCSTVDENSVSFPFSLLISSKRLHVEAVKRFPDRFS